MHASIGELLNGFHRIFLGSVDGVSRTDFGGQLKPVRFEINGNNGGTIDNAGGHDRVHADRARTCLNTAADRAQHAQRDIIADVD